MTAREELIQLGYYDDLTIHDYEQDGVKWEYQVDPLSGEMYVVPEGTTEHEISEIHPVALH